LINLEIKEMGIGCLSDSFGVYRRGLVALGLLVPAGGSDLMPKYRCAAPHSLVTNLAASLGIDLPAYMPS
jgi:hypothetical protein